MFVEMGQRGRCWAHYVSLKPIENDETGNAAPIFVKSNPLSFISRVIIKKKGEKEEEEEEEEDSG